MAWSAGLWLGLALAPNLDRVHACSCGLPGAQGVFAPRDGAAVAPNARVWISTLSPEELQIVDATGEVVDTTSSELMIVGWIAPLTVLTPVAVLKAGETYLIMEGSTELSHFFVHSETDTEPPEAPTLISLEREADRAEGSSCGSVRSLGFRFESRDMVVVRFGEAIALDEFELDPPSGELDDFDTDRHGQGAFFLYGGPCSRWPSETDRLEMQIAALDVAGNFSGWSETQVFERPQFDDGFGCSMFGPTRAQSRSSWFWFAITVAVVIRARRRGTTAPDRSADTGV